MGVQHTLSHGAPGWHQPVRGLTLLHLELLSTVWTGGPAPSFAPRCSGCAADPAHPPSRLHALSSHCFLLPFVVPLLSSTLPFITRSPQAFSVALHSDEALLHSTWDLPGPGLEPVSPVLAGGFLTTAPPGKPRAFVYRTQEKRNRDYVKLCNLSQINRHATRLSIGDDLPANTKGHGARVTDLHQAHVLPLVGRPLCPGCSCNPPLPPPPAGNFPFGFGTVHQGSDSDAESLNEVGDGTDSEGAQPQSRGPGTTSWRHPLLGGAKGRTARHHLHPPAPVSQLHPVLKGLCLESQC
ncbi:hypothetical protein J1605_005656 [Eschrichtius robustus]|uniref:Uncharacterized protein n=1 Tax=Eschrichtius robustus TaxID=9764 RepID=A0AB34H9G7_ESCRO|nr:hypothetical protein J1605_005656 [Eschrichtius robustus]